jgi:hypothetical protein
MANDSDRIDALEHRVAVLEAVVATYVPKALACFIALEEKYPALKPIPPKAVKVRKRAPDGRRA